MVSDCEELVGVNHRRRWVRNFGGYSLYVIPLRYFDVPEILLVHEFPSGEVMMVPVSPTATKCPIP